MKYLLILFSLLGVMSCKHKDEKAIKTVSSFVIPPGFHKFRNTEGIYANDGIIDKGDIILIPDTATAGFIITTDGFAVQAKECRVFHVPGYARLKSFIVIDDESWGYSLHNNQADTSGYIKLK